MLSWRSFGSRSSPWGSGGSVQRLPPWQDQSIGSTDDVFAKRKASRGTARRSVSVRLDLIDSVARSLSSLSSFLAVPDRAYSQQITFFFVSFFSQSASQRW